MKNIEHERKRKERRETIVVDDNLNEKEEENQKEESCDRQEPITSREAIGERKRQNNC